MKTLKQFSLISMLILSVSAYAQTKNFEKESFENWDSSHGYFDPLGWYSLNVLSTVGLPQTLGRTTDAYAGKYAVKLQSKSGLADLTGVISSGPILDNNFNPDFTRIKQPYTKRPKKISFYYKSSPMPHDTCLLAFYMTRWNDSKSNFDTIGQATFATGETITTYTKAEIEITYYSPLPPDSAAFVASSSYDAFNPVIGSAFYLDEIRVGEFVDGVKEQTEKPTAHVYPNPAFDHLHIEAPFDHYTVEIRDLSGRLFYSKTNELNALDIQTGSWTKGVYFMSIKQQENITNHKIIVQ